MVADIHPTPVVGDKGELRPIALANTLVIRQFPTDIANHQVKNAIIVNVEQAGGRPSLVKMQEVIVHQVEVGIETEQTAFLRAYQHLQAAVAIQVAECGH